MPQVEIDEAELLRLRRTGETVAAMLKSPATKRKLLSALKDVRPEDPAVKELDTPDPTEARFDELAKANADLKKQIEDDKADREKQTKIDKLVSDQEAGFAVLRADKWTDDGIAKVKKVMEDKGILDVAIAAKWVESQMPPQNPVTPGGQGSWNFLELQPQGDDDLKALIESKGENSTVLTKMAHEALNDVRGTPRR